MDPYNWRRDYGNAHSISGIASLELHLRSSFFRTNKGS